LNISAFPILSCREAFQTSGPMLEDILFQGAFGRRVHYCQCCLTLSVYVISFVHEIWAKSASSSVWGPSIQICQWRRTASANVSNEPRDGTFWSLLVRKGQLRLYSRARLRGKSMIFPQPSGIVEADIGGLGPLCAWYFEFVAGLDIGEHGITIITLSQLAHSSWTYGCVAACVDSKVIPLLVSLLFWKDSLPPARTFIHYPRLRYYGPKARRATGIPLLCFRVLSSAGQAC
jgi:hypothetical protein